MRLQQYPSGGDENCCFCFDGGGDSGEVVEEVVKELEKELVEEFVEEGGWSGGGAMEEVPF